MAHERDIDQLTGTATTGHEWDGIRELNTPLPRWWLWTFYITIVWSIGYWILYPSWPLISSYAPGVLNWHSRSAVIDDIEALRAQRGALAERLGKASLQEIAADDKLTEFARAQGRPVFLENCAPCHGTGGGGAKGYPNLLDDEWIWGGRLEDIALSIRDGVRTSQSKERMGNMPAFGRDGTLKRPDIEDVADYVRSLAGLESGKGANLANGKRVFAETCATCHGPDGRGRREIGALNLTDAIWLYGSDRASIIDGLWNGRGGVMPAWGERLDEATIKALTIYVHTLGGGVR